MFDYLKKLFWVAKTASAGMKPASPTKPECWKMDEPMSAAGAQPSGEHRKSETEEALERASESRDARR